MFPAEFDYYRAGSLKEVRKLLGQHPGAKLLAGGHTLIPLLKLRLATPSVIIDVGRVAELKGITTSGTEIQIGALTTHAELAASPLIRQSCRALAEAAAIVGDPQVRNRGTIGGNIAHADPASDLPTALTALGGRIVASGAKGKRTIGAEKFFQGVMTTALREGEVLTAVLVPAHAAGQSSAYVKFSHPASRYAVIGVAAALTLAAGKCSAAHVAIGGLVPRPIRAVSVERALVGQALTPALIEAASARVTDDLDGDLIGDIYASAAYRKAMATVYVKRAVTAAGF
jgi:carbon-monoxide dehydrogenase medium subunit